MNLKQRVLELYLWHCCEQNQQVEKAETAFHEDVLIMMTDSSLSTLQLPTTAQGIFGSVS